MNAQNQKPRELLNKAVEEIKNTAIDAQAAQDAADRVWSSLTREAANDSGASMCAEYRGMIAPYLAGTLSQAKALILEDHTRQCIGCYKALRSARRGQVESEPVRPPARRNAVIWKWAAAAAVLLTVGVSYRAGLVERFLWPVDVRATVQAVDGTILSIGGETVRPIAAGEEISRNQRVRTANGSRAVLMLPDGTKVEMRERSELALTAASDGIRVDLARGSVLVQAARQKNGHLYVVTDDCTVAVVGTIFSVSEGTVGSRVSVVEGEVRVEREGQAHSLLPGNQFTTHPSLTPVPVEDDIAWSRDVQTYVALLREFSKINKEVSQMPGQGLRFASTLLPLVSPETIVYAAFPNASVTLTRAYALFQRDVSQNPVLESWWNAEGRQDASGKPTVEELIGRIQQLGDSIGSEIVLSVFDSLNRHDVLVLADVKDANALIAALQDDASRIGNDAARSLRILRTAAEVAAAVRQPARDVLWVYVDDRLMVTSSTVVEIQRALARRASTGLPATRFFTRVVQAYREGADWLFAADLSRVVPKNSAVAAAAGVSDADNIVIEQKSIGTVTANQASIGFVQARNGLASWVGAPGPMGSMDFITPNASGAAAMLTKSPDLMVDDLFAVFRKIWPQFDQLLEQFQNEHHIDLKRDIAGALGGEVTVALDGPVLPVPAIKAIIEVVDAPRFERSIEQIITEINREAVARSQKPLVHSSEIAGGKTYYRIGLEGIPVELNYAFWDGYMVVAPSQALVSQSIDTRNSGASLPKSAGFRTAIPARGRDYASGFLYQNLSSSGLGALMQLGRQIAPAQVAEMKDIVDNAPATLVAVYGEPDRIVFAANGQIAMNLLTAAGFQSLLEQMAAGPRRSR